MKMKYLFGLALFLLSFQAMSWDYVGETGKFQKFMDSNEKVAINRLTHALKLEATEDLFLRECSVFFANGTSRVFKMSYLNKDKSEILKFQTKRNVKEMSCLGTSVNLIGSRGKVKVFIAPLLTPNPNPLPNPNPNPGPRPVPVPVPGPAPGPHPQPLPRVVNLPPLTKKICVKKSKELIQLSVQARWWKVNGQGSNLSTWKYPGAIATLTLDYATADVQAYCKREGSETFSISWMLAFTDPNTYQKQVTVECEACAKPAIDKIKKRANMALNLANENQRERALKQVDEIVKMLDEVMASGMFDDEELAYIEEVVFKLVHDFHNAIRFGEGVHDAYKRLIASLSKLE